MKYNTIKQDRIVVFYNDGIDAPKVPLGRWEFRFGGCKASKGFAPLYVYDIDTRELTALVPGPVALPAMSLMEFHRVALDAAFRGGHWARLMSDEEVIRALDIALECKRDGKRALFFANRMGNFNLMKEALENSGTAFRSMSGATVFADRERILNEFSNREIEDGPVVLLLTDAYAVGFFFRDPETVVVHLDFPENNPATALQRQARIHIGGLASARVFSVSTSLEARIDEAVNAKNSVIDEILASYPDTRVSRD